MRFERSVGAAIEKIFHPVRDKPAVFLNAALYPNYRRVTRIAGDKLLGIVHHHLYRPPAPERQEIAHRHVHEVALAAEATADITGMDDKLLQSPAERVGYLFAQRERHLGAGPDVGAIATVLRPDDAGMRLDVGLMHRLGRKRVLDDDVGFVEADFDIAFFPMHIDEDIARRFDRMQKSAITRHVRMEQRRRRPGRFERIEQRRQFLVFDVDQTQRLLGNRLALCRHRRDFLADKANQTVGEDGHVVNFAADQKAFDVLSGHNRAHAGQSERAARIDIFDAAVRDRAAQNFAPKHSRQAHVGGVDRPPRHFLRPFQPLGRRADELSRRFVMPRPGNLFLHFATAPLNPWRRHRKQLASRRRANRPRSSRNIPKCSRVAPVPCPLLKES